jgi:hypothetical protein
MGSFRVVGTDAAFDVAVFALQEQIARADLEIITDAGGCAAGQEVFFLGYPLGIRGPVFHPGFPIPIIKRGVIASFYHGGIYVSGSANPGFSGGPVFFADHKTDKATLTAVIIQALNYEVPVKDDDGKRIGKVVTDSIIVQASDISLVLSLIKAKPIGFQLQSREKH